MKRDINHKKMLLLQFIVFQVSKFLDVSGAKLDYRRYSDVLFDILFAGGQLGEYLLLVNW